MGIDLGNLKGNLNFCFSYIEDKVLSTCYFLIVVITPQAGLTCVLADDSVVILVI